MQVWKITCFHGGKQPRLPNNLDKNRSFNISCSEKNLPFNGPIRISCFVTDKFLYSKLFQNMSIYWPSPDYSLADPPEEQKKEDDQKTIFPWRVYLAHGLSTWGDNMWWFAGGCFMLELAPGDLRLTATYGQ